jgi:hypothetical protein
MYTEDPSVRRLVDATGNHVPKGGIEVKPWNGSANLASYWSGGSRDLFYVANLATGQVSPAVAENGSGFGMVQHAIMLETLPPGCGLLRVSIGDFKHAVLQVHPENLTPLLSAPSVDLSEDEKTALACTVGLKSAARRENAARKWGEYLVTPAILDRWDKAVAGLLAKGLVAKNGAATIEGRNLRDALKLSVY